MSDDAPTPDAGDLVAASDAYQALGSETRLGVIRALVADEGATSRTFSELQESVEADTSAGFAYHLRQLTDRYVEQTDGAYRLNDAGRQVARALATGRHTERVDRDPVEVGDDCPRCGEPALSVRGDDGHLTVDCAACERELLTVPFSPAGLRSHDDVVSALDRRHRHRIAAMADGTCPDCGGAVECAVDRDAGEGGSTRARLSCRICGTRSRVPVPVTVADHPAVVALYHEHGIDIRERPVWTLGDEWEETVVSEDPLAVRVSTVVGEERLSLYVGRDLTVLHTERGYVGEETADRAAA